MEQLFPQLFPFSVQVKQEKQEKQEAFPKFGNSTEGKYFWKASHSNIWGGKMENMGTQKIARILFWKFRQKALR